MSSIDMPSASSAGKRLVRPEVIGGQRVPALRKSMSQSTARRFYWDGAADWTSAGVVRNKQALLRGENGKRYRLHHPASTSETVLTGTYPLEPAIQFQHPKTDPITTTVQP